MAESDWDTVTVLRKKGPTAAQAKSKQAILAAQRRGEDVETSKKWAAGQNKQHSITKNTAKLDRETEELHHDRVTLEVGKVIQQGRQGKGLTQKDLATKINEKPQVIADYECGRAIPNNQVLGKIERVIGEYPQRSPGSTVAREHLSSEFVFLFLVVPKIKGPLEDSCKRAFGICSFPRVESGINWVRDAGNFISKVKWGLKAFNPCPRGGWEV
uniref:Endothelial differentiation-related factor 1 n=1 Tax=Ornithorhynchus anatinus TaxID=9258 RepID=A0A6I8N374_ORNAN